MGAAYPPMTPSARTSRAAFQLPGLHCAGCGSPAGLAGVVVVLGGTALAVHAVWREIIAVVRVIVLTVEIAALVVVGSAGVALVGLGVVGALRLRARILAARASRAVPAAQVIQLRASQAVTGAGMAAIEAPRTVRWPLPGTWQEINPSNEEQRAS